MSQFVIISYDISDDKRRLKTMKALQDYGTRVQYSVFECRLEPAQLRKLMERIRPFVREPQDSIRFYFVSADDVGRIQVIGQGGVTPDPSFFIQ